MFDRIVFLHPDLGIGGAERLVVDAALAAKESGYSVQFVTNHHDKSHCFEETLQDDLNVKVVGSWLPRSLCGRLLALFAYLRMLVGAIYVILTCDKLRDIVFVDQVSAPLPLLRFAGFKTVFYCHFPDQLLTDRGNWCKALYRKPIDYLEAWSTCFADHIVANSRFTASVIHKTFTSLNQRELEILYPVSNTTSLRLSKFVLVEGDETCLCGNRVLCRRALSPQITLPETGFVFASINRYERKKNLQLALFALSHLMTHWNQLVDKEKSSESYTPPVQLVIAGGYDSRVTENVEYHTELMKLADELKISDHVTFVRSCSAEIKALLIASSDAILYTPDREHFGIVPIEAMSMSRPVIALDSGGPRETIVHGSTGYLCSPESPVQLPELFAECMARFINDEKLFSRMGKAARRHVSDKFSFSTFRTHLCDILSQMNSV